jgi:hypothetical protein
MAASFTLVAYGVDDLTLGFDMEGSRSVRPGEAGGRGPTVSAARDRGADAGVDEAVGGRRHRQLRPTVGTRVDAAVDAECESADGKLLLDVLEAVRLPNGWRTTSTGSPRSTVYFGARAAEHVHARAVLPKSQDEERRALWSDTPGGRAAVRPETVSVGVRRAAGLRRGDLERPLCQPRVEGDATSAGGSSDSRRAGGYRPAAAGPLRSTDD